LIFTIVFGILGFYLPELWLSSAIRSRQRLIVRALPDALDMIVVCTEAGQSFDQALRRVSEYWHNPLTDEFNRILAEVAFGRTRHEALAAASQRIQLNEMSNLIAAIIQADILGVSIRYCASGRSSARYAVSARSGASSAIDVVSAGVLDFPGHARRIARAGYPAHYGNVWRVLASQG
jgi:pilus assembly protein TadC